ncbi:MULTISPECIES: type II secretion system protein XpsI [Lysobacteraceae]|uniref:type II secretion system protein XpsI n=1 Tax=Lysobacteraceae TaxID=32033 RepID=UPI001BCEC59D|nr:MULTISPECIES: type II secretion system protein [Lysobacter]
MNRARRQHGYTLLEVVVAFGVLAVALTILLGILSGATQQVRWSEDAGRAALNAESLLDQAGVGTPLEAGHTEGVFEDGRYRWTLDVTPWKDPTAPPATEQPVDPGAPQMYALDLQVQWGKGTPRERLQLQSLRLATPSQLEPVAP